MTRTKKHSTPKATLKINTDMVADAFISEMRAETGCSAKFLVAARPSIVRLYRDVKGDELEDCLKEIRQLIQRQAETEQHYVRIREDTQMLEETYEQLDNEIRAVRSQILNMRKIVQESSFSLFSVNNIIGRA